MVSCSHLGLRLVGVVLPNALVIDEIVADASGVELGFDPWSLALPDGGKVIARISTTSLASFLNQISPGGLQDCTVAIRDGLLVVEGTKRLIIAMRASITGKLVVEEEKRLVIELLEADVMGTDIRGMIQAQLVTINPILNCDDLPINSRIEAVVVADGFVEVHLSALKTE